MASMLGETAGGTGGDGSFRTKLPVAFTDKDTGNKVINILAIDNGHPQRELLFANDHTEACTVQVTGALTGVNITFNIDAGEVIDERLPEFDNIIIVSGGPWRTYTRSGRMAA